jgi:hypothetical protein
MQSRNGYALSTFTYFISFRVSVYSRVLFFQVSGKDLLPLHNSDLKGKKRAFDVIQVTLVYEGETTIWDLSINMSTRMLYCLVNRATKARYSRFTLRLVRSKVVINDSANLTLGLTDLSHGGEVEISFATVHKRRLSEVVVRKMSRGPEQVKQVVLLPSDAPILALLGYLDPDDFGRMSEILLWYGF